MTLNKLVKEMGYTHIPAEGENDDLVVKSFPDGKMFIFQFENGRPDKEIGCIFCNVDQLEKIIALTKPSVTSNQRKLSEEAKKLYVYTNDHYSEELEQISLKCVAPLIAIKKVVKKSMDSYINEYCNCTDNNIFSDDDFTSVAMQILADKAFYQTVNKNNNKKYVK